MRTIVHAKATDHLGRYYTADRISQLLIEQLPIQNSGVLLDLGSGEGALSVAASAKWTNIELVTVDVDHNASNVLAKRLKDGGFRGVHHYLPHDALCSDLHLKLLERAVGPISVAICNPPFLIPKWRKEYGHILEDAGFSGSLPAITSIDAAALFLAQNLRFLAEGGSLGIIVPDSLACAEKYLGFRTSLLQNYDLLHAIRLPRGSFLGTDALAHIFVISKRQPSRSLIRLSSLNSDGQLQTIDVARDFAVRRLDYAFHAAEMTTTGTGLRLKDVVISVLRGSFNSAEVRASSSFILHTTDINAGIHANWIDFDKHRYQPNRFVDNAVIAEPGDLVLGRVGRNATEKIIGIAKGRVALSDCLYRLRIEPEHREQVLRVIASENGKHWLKMRSYGVAASQITKTDLLNLPLDYL